MLVLFDRRAFCDFTLCNFVDICTYTAKVSVYIKIADTKNRQSHSLKFMCAYSVVQNLHRLIMSAPVKFKNETGLGTIEVGNIAADCLLPLKRNWIIFQKIIP